MFIVTRASGDFSIFRPNVKKMKIQRESQAIQTNPVAIKNFLWGAPLIVLDFCCYVEYR